MKNVVNDEVVDEVSTNHREVKNKLGKEFSPTHPERGENLWGIFIYRRAQLEQFDE